MATAFSRPPFTGRRYTLDEFEQLFPEDWLVELLDGEVLVSTMPTPWHQGLCMRIAMALSSYAESPRLGRVFAPGGFTVEPNVDLHPDVLVTPWIPLSLRWRDMRKWWLAVEVLSPSNRHIDLGRKRTRYMELGLEELWLVDPDAPRVTVVRPGAPDAHIEPPAVLTWKPSPEFAALAIDLASLFAHD